MADEPISWMTLAAGTPIVASDGEEIGRVHEVIADRQKDIFSGITFSDGLLSADRFVPAELIDTITTERVTLTTTAAEAKEKTEPYQG